MTTRAHGSTPSWADLVAQLVADRGRDLFGLAFALTGDASSAEELLDDALHRALSHATPTTDAATLDIYTRRAVFSAFHHHHRGRDRRGRSRIGATAAALARPPQLAPFFAYLDSLTIEERICLVMRFHEGRACIAIGRDLDMLPTSARHHVSSAISKMGASFEKLGMTREFALYGGEGSDTAAPAVPDALTAAFRAIDVAAAEVFASLDVSRDPSRISQVHHARLRKRATTVGLLTAAAVASLGWAGWTVLEVALPSSEGVAVQPSPSPVAGPYGPGVLSSQDLLDASSPWSPSSDDAAQRASLCVVRERAPSASPSESTIAVVSDPGRVGRSTDFGSGPTVDRTCSLLTTDAIALTTSITPYEGSLGGDRVSMVVKITNAGGSPVALYGDSVTVNFELPWGALSTVSESSRNSPRLWGDSLDSGSLVLSIPESITQPAVVTLEPGETLTVVLQSYSASRWLRDLRRDPEFVITDDILRAASLMGEMSPDDGVLGAFESGDYMPRAGISVGVAPTDPTSSDLVVLTSIHEAIGAIPTPSAS